MIIVSDGSADPQGSAGSACIVRGAGGAPLWKRLAFLGEADSAVAELFGGVLALAELRANVPAAAAEEVCWVCDHQPTREGVQRYLPEWEEAGWQTLSGEPLRHAPLWKLLANLRQDMRLRVEAPQSGGSRRDHRACDRASRWAARSGARLLREQGEGAVGRLAERDPNIAWQLVDMRLFLEQLVAGMAIAEAAARLQTALRKTKLGKK